MTVPYLTLDVSRLKLPGITTIPVELVLVGRGKTTSEGPPPQPNESDSSTEQSQREELSTKAVLRLRYELSVKDKLPRSWIKDWVRDRYRLRLSSNHFSRDKINFGFFVAYLADGPIVIGKVTLKKGDPERWVITFWTPEGLEAHRLWFKGENKPPNDFQGVRLGQSVLSSKEQRGLLDEAHRRRKPKITVQKFMKLASRLQHPRWKIRRDRIDRKLKSDMKESLRIIEMGHRPTRSPRK